MKNKIIALFIALGAVSSANAQFGGLGGMLGGGILLQTVGWRAGFVWLGAIGLVQPFSRPLRQAAGWGLALYALCVWPANINHFAMDMARADGGLGLGYHVPRMFAQPVIIWLALWVGECWPLRRRPLPPGA